MLILNYRTGVTLVEMLIVVAIVAVLVGIVLGITGRMQDQASEQLTKETFTILESALEEYREYMDEFPLPAGTGDPNDNSEKLYYDLLSVGASREIVQRINNLFIFDGFANPSTPIEGPEIYDGWKKVVIDYKYWVDSGDPSNRDTFPRLTSAGADGVFGTVDDLTNR